MRAFPRAAASCVRTASGVPGGTWRSGPGGLRHSEEAQDRCLILPLYPRMPEQDQDYVVTALKKACQR